MGLRKLTLLHLAEQRAGRRAFRRWARGATGRPIEVATGSCSKGFPRLEAVLRPLGQEATVGQSCWRVFPAAAALDAAAGAIRREPTITHCGRPDCEVLQRRGARRAARCAPLLPGTDIGAASTEPGHDVSGADRFPAHRCR